MLKHTVCVVGLGVTCYCISAPDMTENQQCGFQISVKLVFF